MRGLYGIAVVLAVVSAALAFDGPFGSSRIIGGSEASAGQFPYQAALLITKPGGGSWCGGVLISDKHVLTAAHCAIGATYIDVYLGAIEIRNLEEEGRLNLRVNSSNIDVHENYNPTFIRNDIALLTLHEPIEFTDRISPIKLPTYSDVAIDFSGRIVTASGWGRTNDELGSGISSVLRYANVNVQPPGVCRTYFEPYVLDSNICTETAYGQGICNGDSGGPVAIDINGNKVLLGLSSFVSSRGCVKCWPSVFVRVSYFLDWIKQHSALKLN